MTEWIDRAEALKQLAVKPQTLYAYVSRGRIEARRAPAGARHSLYRAQDVAEIARRAQASKKPAAIAAGSMAWGEASLVTHISTVERGHLIYRGRDAVQLAQSATLERTAAILWDCEPEISFPVPARSPSTPFAALGELATTQPATIARNPAALRRDACAAIGVLASSCGVGAGVAPLHEALAALWKLGERDADRVRRALVLVADHELNASTFAARVTASTGAPIAACLIAGLSALCGPRHGGATAALTRLLREAARVGAAAAARAWLNRHGAPPGFGHPLYPDGDERVLALVDQPDALMSDLAAQAAALTGEKPNVDFALVALARGAGLPADAPFVLFLLGRSVGWAAHAMEQIEQGALIRPRARYEGVRTPPEN